MKKFILTLLLTVVTVTMMAVPAKRGLWKTLKLQDGTEVRAQLVGDEFGACWRGVDGKNYVKSGDSFVILNSEIAKRSNARKEMALKSRAKRLKANVTRRAAGNRSALTGDKKGLIILVNFKNTKFQTSDAETQALYNNVANTQGYSDDNGFSGSVADYFKDQSRGVFNLTFDVVGPVTVSRNAAYYGENDAQTKQDKRPAEMVIEAVNLAKSKVNNWQQYDWDNDGEVDQVMIIYAGEGEASGGAEATIWPHEYSLASAKYYGEGTGPVTVDNNLKVNTYAVANEGMVEQSLFGESFTYMGIGTICHEFSHCLGLMDMYDTAYGGNFGMDAWSLMDQGSYNNNGFTPANYTSFEKQQIGWITPKELTTATTVTALQALADADDFYRITNKGNENEYYLLENRQQKGWDQYVPSSGLLVLHVDYDDEIWAWNLANTNNSDASEGVLNDHQRCTIFHADGKEKSAELYAKLSDLVTAYENEQDDDKADAIYEEYEKVSGELDKDLQNDVFPIGSTELSNTTTPRAFTYNANSDGRKLMNIKISEITQNADGTIAFNFAPDNSGTEEGDNTEYSNIDDPVTPPSVEGALFYESFDQCDGTGGNDGTFSGNVGTASKFKTDNSGWTANGDKYYGCYRCAKFGTSSVKGEVTSPSFAVNGTGTMTFMAAPFGTDGTTLNLSVSNGTISPATVTMKAGEFTNFTATITATGNVKVTFTPAKRLFLDEVLVVDPNATAIQTINSNKTTTTRIYTLDGRYVGTDPNQLPRGLYIINGKKIVK
jgi:M6 family metalloprotease-like protein